jgi:serine/threonine-protein kinase RsbW
MSDSYEFSADSWVVTYDRVFPADPSEIDRVVESVMAIVGQIGCADGREHDIELALREALANAIRHGCKNDSSKQVQCTVACDEHQGMLVVVRDSGEGFDPSTVPSPLMGENVFRHHGRGIYLISQLMDEVRFEKGGTEIHMRKRGPGSTSSSSTS